MATDADARRASIEAWWALVARILAFVLGSMILCFQAFVVNFDRPILLLVATGLMGPTVAASVAQLLSAWRGGSNE